MNITVDYGKRKYGLGDTVRHYKVTLREINGFYMDFPVTAESKYYNTREIELSFRSLSSTAGRGWEGTSEAEVVGGKLELSHDAARELANAILKFIEPGSQSGHPLELQVSEKPLPRPDA
jgi:hypothetical protein